LEIFYATGEMTSSMCWHIGGGLKHRNSHRHRIFIDREHKNWLITLIKFQSKDKLYLWWMVYFYCVKNKLSYDTILHRVWNKELDHVRTILTSISIEDIGDAIITIIHVLMCMHTWNFYKCSIHNAHFVSEAILFFKKITLHPQKAYS